MRHVLKSQWFSLVKDQQKKLITTAVDLYEREYSLGSNGLQTTTKFSDYSFIVFPMSKAFEGFLKQRFYDFRLIDKKTFEGKRFRIGKALNPDLHERSRDEYWLFDDLEKMCGKELAVELWDTWLTCRNRVFHFFPLTDNTFSLETAGKHLLKISNSMKMLMECQVELEEHEVGNIFAN